MSSDDPFSNVYTDQKPYDREELADAITDFIQIDAESGDPIPQPAFHDLSLGGQTIALMLYRHVAVELGELDEDLLRIEAIWFDENSDIDEGQMFDVPTEFKFVEEDDGRFFIPEPKVDTAVDYLRAAV